MDNSVLLWLIVFIVSAILFFGTAVVITVVGVRDLKDLLDRSATKGQDRTVPPTQQS